MYLSAGIVLGVMVTVYIIALRFKLSTELAMIVAALGGALAAGHWFPARHVAEGAITYMDINLIFISATLFMNILKESGGIAFVVRAIIKTFHKSRVLLLILLTFLLLIPGALTGAGSVTVLITGGLVAVVLNYMGIKKIRIAAIIFLIAGLSAAAPPVSLWAMMTAAGVNMPYVGFFLPLLIPCVVGALFTIFFLGWKGTKIDVEKAFEELPKPPEKMNWWRIVIPFLVFFGLIFIGRKWPHDTPVIGMPLMFLLAALFSWILSPVKLKIFSISANTIKQLLPLIGTLTAVGILVQIMTLTGVRGLLAIAFITLPTVLVIGSLFIFLPITESVLMYGSAAVFGVPLVLLFNTMGLNPIVALAGMSVIWPLGDALPPTAIIGRLTVDVVGTKEKYSLFLKQCLVPAILISILGTLMVIFSKDLGFLTGL
ncbi:MAG: C4-dicarboxylate ABC transporter [Bacteroidetes bacterium]|nr:C4-dicarboxylate ABC transporter [Bacteroidota bacterium]MBT4410554.1 C4-dicarboxylate ABC transporter [Bacteroidota bacterium]MBT5426614.1 C4-dicarboxylate ABC transporter [Bacteroidota bacterium]MBT7094575.1 C4-dicarboxylate ABC transporter [Bacteroidota bacterium]